MPLRHIKKYWDAELTQPVEDPLDLGVAEVVDNAGVIRDIPLYVKHDYPGPLNYSLKISHGEVRVLGGELKEIPPNTVQQVVIRLQPSSEEKAIRFTADEEEHFLVT